MSHCFRFILFNSLFLYLFQLDGDIAALQREFTSTIATLQSSLSGLQMNVTEVRDKLNELIAMLQQS